MLNSIEISKLEEVVRIEIVKMLQFRFLEIYKELKERNLIVPIVTAYGKDDCAMLASYISKLALAETYFLFPYHELTPCLGEFTIWAEDYVFNHLGRSRDV